MNRAPNFKKNWKTRDERVKELNQERRNQRNNLLGAHRNIIQSPPLHPELKKSPKKKTRLELLKEWQILKQAKENKNIKKPPFHAGKLQRKANGSPLVTQHMLGPAQNRVTTRAQAKKNILKNPIKLHRLNKAVDFVLNPIENHAFVPPKGIVAMHKLTVPMSPNITKSARKSVKPLQDIGDKFTEPTKKNLRENFKIQPKELYASATNIKVTSKVKDLAKVNSNIDNVNVEEINSATEAVQDNLSAIQSKEDLKKNAVDGDGHQINNVNKKMEYSPNTGLKPPINFDHLVFSPLVEKKRGSARRSFGAAKKLCVDEEIDLEETERKSRIASFRLFLENETNRLLALAQHWRKIGEDTINLPADVQGDIDAVSGKTKLLTSDKFKQFQGLIDKHESGDPLIKVDDLQGFHDWVSLEIEDLDKTFFALKEGYESNWTSCTNKIENKKKIIKKLAKPIKKATGVTSNMRAHIMAARKKMVNKASPVPETSYANSKSSSPHLSCFTTPKDPNLRVKALKRCSGIEIMTATLRARLSQSPDIQTSTTKLRLDNQSLCKTPALYTTPLKSILRPTAVTVPKSDRKVGFGLDPIYLQPAQDSPSDDSPEVLRLIDNSTPRPRTRRPKTPNMKPLRRSERLLSKSPFEK